MRLAVTTEQGDFYNLDVAADMELENLCALLEADCQIPVPEQTIFHNGKPLSDLKKTLAQCGIANDDIILLQRKASPPAVATSSNNRTQSLPAQDPFIAYAERIRQQIVSDPVALSQISQNNPELAEAAISDPTRFASVLRERERLHKEAENRKFQEINALNADPFDPDAQKKIEEAIRLERVMENMEAAMEHHPEAFGHIHMLYINTEVNGVPVKAFVDSGAQSTIMSPDCAEKTGLMRLNDTRYSGIARGVGTAKILGRVHSAPIKVGESFLACSFTIMEGKGVDLLFGLDMLKRHQACIDLKKNCLTINGQDVRFLSEHELPESAKMTEENPEEVVPSV